jgi:predicted DNA-binding protein
MNTQEHYWDYKLVNFNVPRDLIDKFDYINRRKSTTRTSTLLSLIEGWVREQEDRYARNRQERVYETDEPLGFWSTSGEHTYGSF